MILSHEFRYIFVKTRKTAGTSIEIALSRFCGPSDVITPISPADEAIRRTLQGRGPQNYRLPQADASPSTGIDEFFNHMPASEIKRLIEPAIWDTYFKVCFVRNPWDLAVSRYFFAYRHEPRPPFARVLRTDARLLQSSHDLYTIDGRLAVDAVYRFERLERDVESFAKSVRLPGSLLPLPEAKTGFRTDRRHYRSFFERAERDLVAECCAREIALFGYEW